MKPDPRGRSGDSDPFDLWMRHRLHKGFDAVTEEPIPEDLLRLACDSRNEWDALRSRWMARSRSRSQDAPPEAQAEAS
ncbi:hypothetical protein [Muricoccus radiodurans]|uniref:hypothetical protein n=1 Tax=Muricoccus radiodurans TaxID=2231721 RepID=UPI003CEA9A39